MTDKLPRRSIDKIKLRGELRPTNAGSFDDFIKLNQWERRGASSKRAHNFVDKPPTESEVLSALRPYAEAVGQVNIQWNNLQESFATCFWMIFQGNNEEAVAVWNTINSDRTQRQMLKEAARVKFIVGSHHPSVPDELAARSYEIFDALDFLLDYAVKFEDARNNAIHVPIKIGISADCFYVYADDESFRAQSFKKKINDSNSTIIDELIYIRRSLSVLNKFASRLIHAWMTEQALPERPRVPHRAPLRPRSPSRHKT